MLSRMFVARGMNEILSAKFFFETHCTVNNTLSSNLIVVITLKHKQLNLVGIFVLATCFILMFPFFPPPEILSPETLYMMMWRAGGLGTIRVAHTGLYHRFLVAQLF